MGLPALAKFSAYLPAPARYKGAGFVGWVASWAVE